MRTLGIFSAVLILILLPACDQKPAKPPTPKIDAAPATDAASKPNKDESPAQTGY